MAKNDESLIKSREVRSKILSKYGEIPKSIYKPDYSWGKHVIEFEERKQHNIAIKKHKTISYGNTVEIELQDGTKKEVEIKSQQQWNAYNASSKSIRGKTGGLSTFPPALAKRIVLFYSNKGDTVLDPCAGHNSRMQVTYELERNYIGYDISKEFMEFNEKIKAEITGGGSQSLMFTPKNSIVLKEKSSEKLDEEDNSINMVYTSPPYWDLEYYGEEEGQIGYNHTYEEFLGGLGRIVNECYRVLKSDSYCIFNVNDFRKNGVMYTYHSDVIDLFKKAGFKMHDVIIVEWASAMGACFASQVEERKITAKSHEYLIIGKK